MFSGTPGEILVAIGLIVGMPGVPDFGIQLTLAIIIGMLLPESVIKPINVFLIEILPPMNSFEYKLRKIPRIKTIIPRIIAGYLFTFVIGLVLIAIGLLI
ncbi:MAG: hypothetical protein J7K87_01160 [Candidatus Aenigmarchaeota archaeon]|nr:hypothetical protein [Candidatus Aenigmarchaeota archaeon]